MSIADLCRGALAGGLGGVVGGAVKLACEAVVPPRTPDRDPPPGVLVAKIVRTENGRELSKDEMNRAAMSIHWIFSVLSGAALGVANELYPELEQTQGVPFGIAIWASLHEIVLPLTGATPPLPELPAAEQVNEFITHCLYGFSVERVRQAIRPLLAPL